MKIAPKARDFFLGFHARKKPFDLRVSSNKGGFFLAEDSAEGRKIWHFIRGDPYENRAEGARKILGGII